MKKLALMLLMAIPAISAFAKNEDFTAQFRNSPDYKVETVGKKLITDGLSVGELNIEGDLFTQAIDSVIYVETLNPKRTAHLVKEGKKFFSAKRGFTVFVEGSEDGVKATTLFKKLPDERFECVIIAEQPDEEKAAITVLFTLFNLFDPSSWNGAVVNEAF